MADNSIASNEPNLNAFYTTPQYCLEIIHAHAEYVKWEDKPGGPAVAGCMAKQASAWAEVLLPEAKRLNVGMQAFPLWLQGVVEASGLDGGMGERAWRCFRTVEQLWPKVDAELVRLREAAISEAMGEVEPAQTATPPAERIRQFVDDCNAYFNADGFVGFIAPTFPQSLRERWWRPGTPHHIGLQKLAAEGVELAPYLVQAAEDSKPLFIFCKLLPCILSEKEAKVVWATLENQLRHSAIVLDKAAPAELPAIDAPRIIGFLDAELIQQTFTLTKDEWESVRQKLKYWKRTNEDKVKPITDDPDKPPRYLYPAAIVEGFVAKVRAK